ncbi:MAG: hypothetical protein KME57_15625 [Scytonema hyalinum WJT4-NPBG1]|jgi:hypothetical protein|nr:hypothetical protein [Scytonema hyalinum WJT4-NPBG1]
MTGFFDFDDDLDIDFQIDDALERRDIDALHSILTQIRNTIMNYPEQASTFRERICNILEQFPTLKSEFLFLWNKCSCPLEY